MKNSKKQTDAIALVQKLFRLGNLHQSQNSPESERRLVERAHAVFEAQQREARKYASARYKG